MQAKGHSFSGWTVQKAATCQATGTESRKCSVCGNTETRTVAKLGHSFGSWKTVKQPTCAEAGTEERICSVGGEKETRSIAATGAHKWGSLIVDLAADCDRNGSGHYECKVCGAEGDHETIPKTGHDYQEYSEKQIDDTTVEVTYRCANCGSKYSVKKKV